MQSRSFALLLLLLLLTATATATLAQESPYIFDSNRVDPSFFGDEGDDLQQPGNRANSPSSRIDEIEVLEYGIIAPEFNATNGGNLTRLENKGVGTMAYSYEPISPFGAMELSCSTGFVEPIFQGAYVGLSEQFYREGGSCGACVEISCDDSSCGEPGRKAFATVVDLCGRCFGADMNIATPLFSNLTLQDPALEITNRQIAVSWRFVDCSPFIEGTIKMLVKPDGNAYFQAFSFSNSRQPIVAATLLQGNGVPPVRLRRSTSNWWEYNPGKVIDASASYGLALLGANRQVLQIVLRGLVNQDLGVQYDIVTQNSTIPPPPPPAAASILTPPPPPTTVESEPAVAVQVQEEEPQPVPEGTIGGRKMLQSDGRVTVLNAYPELLSSLVSPEVLSCTFEEEHPVPPMYQFHYGSINFQTAGNDVGCGSCIELTKTQGGDSHDRSPEATTTTTTTTTTTKNNKTTTIIMIMSDCLDCEDGEIKVNDFAYMSLFRRRENARGYTDYKVVECDWGSKRRRAAAAVVVGVVEGQEAGSRSQTDLDDKELFLSEIDGIIVPAPEDVVAQLPAIEEEALLKVNSPDTTTTTTTTTTTQSTGTAFPTMWYTSSTSQEESQFYTNKMACGLGGIKPPYTVNFASINLRMSWKEEEEGAPPCGQCALVECVRDENDSNCPLGNDGLEVVIVEDCGDCGPGDIRIDALSLADNNNSDGMRRSFKAKWALKGCQSSSSSSADDKDGIYIYVAPGVGSEYYQQVTFSNSVQPIVKAKLNGEELKMRGYPFRWEWYENGTKLSGGSRGKVEVELEGKGGSIVRKVVDMLESQYLGVNFSKEEEG